MRRKFVQSLPQACTTTLDAHLFDRVGTVLLHAQEADVVGEFSNELGRVAGIRKIQYILHDVVAEGVLHESQGVISYLSNQLRFLWFRRVVETALEDAASVFVTSDFQAMFCDGLENKLKKKAERLVGERHGVRNEDILHCLREKVS
jgi:hypothetical protein